MAYSGSNSGCGCIEIARASFLTEYAIRPHAWQWGTAWALVMLIYENQTRYRTPEDLLSVLKVAAGHYTSVPTADGEIRVPNSVSFSAMDQTEFERFWDRVVTVVCEQIVPGMDREDLERELMGMVA